MADKSMSGMPGMGNMPGMNMGDPDQAAKILDPTKDQMGMDTGAPAVQPPSPFLEEGMKNMPMATPKQVWTVTGTEDWTMLRGFRPASGMVAMMDGMMVEGGPMQSMKMGKMDMSMAEMPAPTPEQARTAANTPPVPATADQPPVSAPVDQTPVSTAPAQPAPTRPTAGPLTVKGSLPSARVGDSNLMTLTITDSTGKPIPGATVTSTVAMATMDMGTTHLIFKDVGDGKYQGKIGFGMAGSWRVTVHVAASGQNPVSKAFTFNAK